MSPVFFSSVKERKRKREKEKEQFGFLFWSQISRDLLSLLSLTVPPY